MNAPKRRANCDETGLEMATCRHSITQKALNMFQGELYGYSYYIVKNLLIPKKTKFFWCDVVCKMWPWLKRVDPEMCQTLSPALSVFHALQHDPSCQVSLISLLA